MFLASTIHRELWWLCSKRACVGLLFFLNFSLIHFYVCNLSSVWSKCVFAQNTEVILKIPICLFETNVINQKVLMMELISDQWIKMQLHFAQRALSLLLSPFIHSALLNHTCVTICHLSYCHVFFSSFLILTLSFCPPLLTIGQPHRSLQQHQQSAFSQTTKWTGLSLSQSPTIHLYSFL